ncbi:NAD(P)-dependent oxidoreductase [Bradyrhizobium sp. B120]|uniref:NAD(P)-dependent oxidoreductase n=1 Tax=Bradyrhizobium sp. B120 TaxID=3410088 RepID=UPI003B983EDC
MKVVCTWYATQEETDAIKAVLPADAQIVVPQGKYLSRFDCTYATLRPHLAEADVIMGWALPNGTLEAANKVKLLNWIHSGCDGLDVRLLKERGTRVASARGANAAAIAEQAMMFVLALAKATIVKHQALQQGRWLFPLWGEDRSAMLSGRTVGVIGVGSIGGLIAKAAKGFGMRVIGVRRHKEQPAECVDAMHGLDELRSVLPQCDYVVLAVPNTEETYDLFGEEELAAMKPSAFLVNVARPALVQEQPLYDALTTGRLRGYAADVWRRYEYGRAFPIGFMPRLEVHKLPNVIGSLMEAHDADDVLERNLQLAIENLAEFVAGKRMTREIDLERGY